MITVRHVGGVALFLFGTTFLWLTPAFATRGIPTGGLLWALTGFLALVIVAGFTLSTWGLFRQASWWEGLAVGSAALGVVVLVPYWIAAVRSGETTPAFNVFVHALGSAGVFALLLVSSAAALGRVERREAVTTRPGCCRGDFVRPTGSPASLAPGLRRQHEQYSALVPPSETPWH